MLDVECLLVFCLPLNLGSYLGLLHASGNTGVRAP